MSFLVLASVGFDKPAMNEGHPGHFEKGLAPAYRDLMTASTSPLPDCILRAGLQSAR